jgi:uncharacterized protein YjiS (DUF1127 family)
MMSAPSLRPVLAASRPGLSRPGVWRRISDCVAVFAQRRALARLDDAALDDIGVTREAADAEAMRPFWDLPARLR